LLWCFIGYSWGDLTLYDGSTVHIYRWGKNPWGNITTLPLVFPPSALDSFSNVTITEPSCLVFNPKSSFYLEAPTLKSILKLNITNSSYIACILIPTISDRWVEFVSDYVQFPYTVATTDLSTSSFLAYKALSANQTIMVTFNEWDPNTCVTLQPLNFALEFILLVLNFSCMLWALSKMFLMYRSYGQFMVNIANVCLSMEALCCLFRFLYCCTFLGYIWESTTPNYPRNLNLFFNYLAYPFTLSSGIFLMFFWIDMTSGTLYKGTFIDKAFWPSVVFVVISFLFLWIPACIFLVNRNPLFLTYTGAAILILSAIVAIIFFVTAWKIDIYTKDRSPSQSRELKLMTIKIVVSGIIILLIVIDSFLVLNYREKWLPYYILLWLDDFLFLGRSFFQIEVFGIAKNQRPTATSSSADSHSTDQSMNSTAASQ